MKKIVSSILAIMVVLSMVFSLSSCTKYSAKMKDGNLDKKKSLAVHDDGSFRILQITDMHLVSNGANRKDRQTMRWLEQAIDVAKPDLIELSGDLTGSGVHGRNNGLLAVANYLEERQIYWCYVFGNHDGEHSSKNGRDFWIGKEGKQTNVKSVCSGAKNFDESKGTLFYGDNSTGNKELFDLLGGYEYCLTRRDPLEEQHQDTMGVGNYVVNLVDKEDNIVFALIHMDTHGKTYVDPIDNEEGPKGYRDTGYVGLTDMQVEWYRNTIKEYSKRGIKSALFMHVPNYGFREATETYKEDNEFGIPQFEEKKDVQNSVKLFKDTKFLKSEGIYGPKWDDGLENVMDKYKSTNLISVGHDHNNCFFITKDISNKHKDAKEEKNEIILAYGRCSGVNAWGRFENVGATIYDVNTKGKTIDDIYEIKEIYPDFKYNRWDQNF